MNASTRATVTAAVLFFFAGGGISAWFTSGNDLLHIADVRTDIVLAFFLGGIFAAVVGAGTSLILEKVTDQHD